MELSFCGMFLHKAPRCHVWPSVVSSHAQSRNGRLVPSVVHGDPSVASSHAQSCNGRLMTLAHHLGPSGILLKTCLFVVLIYAYISIHKLIVLP